MIPVWKLKREIRRVFEQVSAVPLLIYEPLYQIIYDKNFDKRLLMHYGDKSFGKKIAIFLIYQPNGLAESIYLTIDHLLESGFCPLVVSNCSLLSKDVEKLRLKSPLIVERKNFGYDFGGYRDAVWLLRRLQIKCEVMLFLNDSVWFPVFDNSKMLREMNACDADYVGTQAFGEILSDGSFNGFFGSYCFLIKKPLLDSHSYQMYWDNYKMSSSKEVVLRRGERSFSRQMLMSCNNSLALFSHERFSAIVHEMNMNDTVQALEDLIVWDEKILFNKKILLESINRDHEWMMKAKDLIILLSKSKNFIGSSPLISIGNMRFPMIKKNNEMLYSLARNKIIQAIDSGRLKDINKIIERELRVKSLTN